MLKNRNIKYNILIKKNIILSFDYYNKDYCICDIIL